MLYMFILFLILSNESVNNFINYLEIVILSKQILMQEKKKFIWKYILSKAKKKLQIYISHCRKHLIKNKIQKQNNIGEWPTEIINTQYLISIFIWR